MRTIFGSALAVPLAMALSLVRSSAEETQGADMRLYPPTTIEWKTGPAALPPGARMAVLEGDPTKEGPFVVRFQFPEGYHIPPHTHPKTERVTVISGTLYLATGEALDRVSAKKLPAGSFGYWPAGMKHTRRECSKSSALTERRYSAFASSCAFSRNNSPARFICSFSLISERAS